MARSGDASAIGAADFFLGSGILCGDSGAGGNVRDSPPQSAATAAHRLRSSGPRFMVGWTLPRRTLGGLLTETAPATSGPPGVFWVEAAFSAAITLKPSQFSPAAAPQPLQIRDHRNVVVFDPRHFAGFIDDDHGA